MWCSSCYHSMTTDQDNYQVNFDSGHLTHWGTAEGTAEGMDDHELVTVEVSD